MSSIDALQDCLAAEHAACFGYAALGGALAGIPDTAADETRADEFYAEHLQARDDLTDLIASLDAEPVAARASYAVRVLTDAPACRRLAIRLEHGTAAAYAYAVAETSDEQRSAAADALTECALRATAWGATPVPLPGLR